MRRFGRVLTPLARPGEAQGVRNGSKIGTKSGRKGCPSRFRDLIPFFHEFLMFFGFHRYSKVFKLHRKNAMIPNGRVVHSQDTTMQTVFGKHAKTRSKSAEIWSKMEPRPFLTPVPDAIWKNLEGSTGPNGSSGRARRPDPRYIRQI